MCEKCSCSIFEIGGFGMDSCTGCGMCTVGEIADLGASYWPRDQVLAKQLYTRRKRFKKYLQRANREQSSNTVPEETWKYLIDKQPFRDVGELYLCLKSARHLKRKCYDSMPLICSHLCPQEVPRLSAKELQNALEMFDLIDRSVPEGPFISYLFCLEYIFTMLGRTDMVIYINRIKCEKRRRAYRERLDKIFVPLPRETVALQLQVPSKSRLAPDGAPGLNVRDLARDVPCRRVGTAPGGFR